MITTTNRSQSEHWDNISSVVLTQYFVANFSRSRKYLSCRSWNDVEKQNPWLLNAQIFSQHLRTKNSFLPYTWHSCQLVLKQNFDFLISYIHDVRSFISGGGPLPNFWSFLCLTFIVMVTFREEFFLYISRLRPLAILLSFFFCFTIAYKTNPVQF